MLETINQDIKEAMKSKEKEKLQALRYLKSMLMENATSKKPDEEINVIIKYHKKLQDSLENFPESNPLRTQTEYEIRIIEHYLPKQLSEDEVIQIIKKIQQDLDNPNMGSIMKSLSEEIKGKFNGKRASELVKELLN